ncbi:MAG: DUF5808 domain-containing protein [Clostridium sp.]|nr:DUF5808 domain-containing protein [Clostridium sp.]
MSLINIIFIVTGIIVILCEVAVWISCSYGDKNLVFGVTIPTSELKNENINLLKTKYKALWHKYLIISIVTFIPVLFLGNLDPYNILYIVLWACIASIYFISKPYIVIHNELMAIKKKNGWFSGKTREITIDTKASLLKNEKVISIYWLIGSFIIPIACFPLVKNISLILPISDLVIKVIILFLYKYTLKLKTKVYSENSNINVALNCTRQRLLSIFWTMASYIDSIIIFIACIIISRIVPYKMFSLIPSITIAPILMLMIIMYYLNKFKNIKSELLNSDDKPIIVDDDEYWINGLFYCNPNDSSLLVEKRGGIGMTFNFGKKSGKIITYITIIFTASILIFISVLFISEGSYNPSLNISNTQISIDCPLYSTSFFKSNISNVSLIQNMPSGIRTNGIGTSEYSRGHFNINNYGNSLLYVYNNNPYIVIKLKDKSYIFFNYKNKSDTLNLYNKLKTLK